MTDPSLIDRLEAGFETDPLPYRLGVAVSGGSDSLALLHLLHASGKFALSAVTVNHGLRAQAASEALHVARICDRLGIQHDVVEWQGWDGRGNLQDQARRNRYSLIADWARRERLDGVAVGHTRDDQAETVLMRLSRASGVDGLSGMPSCIVRDGMTFWRPLLGVGREALREYLTDLGVRWVEDPSNEDDQFDRVRARKALGVLATLGVTTGGLAQVAHNMAEARTALDQIAADWALRSARVECGDVILDRTSLSGLPNELQRRIVSAALTFVSSAEYPPRRDALADLLAAIKARRNHTLGGCFVMVSDITVRITREVSAIADLEMPTTALWDHRWRLEGPHDDALVVRPLGNGILACPTWRETRLPRSTLVASPAIWDTDRLVAAPVAGFGSDWIAHAPGLDAFVSHLIAH